MLILTHRLHLRTGQGDTPVDIRVYRPEAEPDCWGCRYEIDWPERTRRFQGYGVDALQALILTLMMIGSELYTSAHHAEGRLHCYDDGPGYGFPLPHILRDLVAGHDGVVQFPAAGSAS